MNIQQEQGSAHIIVISLLSLIIIGLVGFLFWQNVINKPGESTDNQAVVAESAQGAEASSETEGESAATSLVDTKKGIAVAMNADQFKGLENYMAPTVERLISHTDAGIMKAGPSDTVKSLYEYFATYDVDSNNQPRVKKWTTFANVTDITDEKFKKQATGSQYYNGTYVAIADGAGDDIFVAFRFDNEGKINYVFQGSVLGF